MADKHLVNFTDLLNLSFDDGSVNLKHLQMVLKILVKQLKLENVEVTSEDQNLLLDVNNVEKSSENVKTKSDSVLKTISEGDEMMKKMSKNDSNPAVDMMEFLNVTKRVEALEVSIQNLASSLEITLKKESLFDKKIETQSNEQTSQESRVMQPDESLTEKKKSSTFSSSSDRSPSTSSVKSSKLDCDTKNFIRQQIDANTQFYTSMMSNLKQNICDIQKQIFEHKELIEDLFYASEQNDLRVDETAQDIKDFNSKIFCLKSDVKMLLNDAKEFKEKFIEMDEKLETINNVKTNKSYVDELWRQKAFKSDLEKLVPRDEFDPMTDILRLKLALLDETCTKLKENLITTLSCFKSEMDEKLDKPELVKFKTQVSELFDAFVNELKVLLQPLVKNPIGAGGISDTEAKLNCISCETAITMDKSAVNIPKFGALCHRFVFKLDKIDMPAKRGSSYPGAIRKLLVADSKPKNEKNRKLSRCLQNDSLLNFPNSKPCYIIAQDKTVVRADPLKCLNNPKYSNQE